MSIAEAFKEGFKFLNKLLDLFRARRRRKESADGNSVTLTAQIPHEVSEVDMLRRLAKDIEWLPLQEDVARREINICWALQLTFQVLRHSLDGEEMAGILRDMRKLSFERALKRFNSDCPGLPSMLNAVCECCCTLYDSKEEIQHLTLERTKEIAGNAVEICRNLLLPFVKREETQTLFPDAAMAISNSIEVFRKTVERYSRDWSEDLEEQLRGAVELIPSVLMGIDLSDVGIGEKLKEFANEIPSALETLAQEHPEKWLLALREVCSRRPPKNIRGPLCRLWRRLLVVSRSEAFGFLRRLIEVTFESVWTQVEYEASSEQRDSGAAEVVVGCIHDLVRQCCHDGGARFGFYWHSQVRPVVVGYMTKRQEELGRERGPVQEYLQKIISLVDRLPKRQKRERPITSVKEVPPTAHDPDDSLCGALGCI